MNSSIHIHKNYRTFLSRNTNNPLPELDLLNTGKSRNHNDRLKSGKSRINTYENEHLETDISEINKKKAKELYLTNLRKSPIPPVRRYHPNYDLVLK